MLMPQFVALLPFQQQFTKTPHGRRIIIFLPDQYERDSVHWLQQNEMQDGCGCHNGFGDDTDSRASFHVAHDCADETWGMCETWCHAGMTATSDHCVVQADAFAASQNNERFAREDGPGHG